MCQWSAFTGYPVGLELPKLRPDSAEATETYMKGVLSFTDEELVSSDFIHNVQLGGTLQKYDAQGWHRDSFFQEHSI